MKQLSIYLLALLPFTTAGCSRPALQHDDEQTAIHQGSGIKLADRHITVDILLPTTPIKDQGNTELCWIYALLATIETNQLAKGDSINLSPLWLERKALEEGAQKAYLANEGISLRGTLMEAMRLYSTYGMVPYDSYHTTEGGSMEAAAANTRVLSRKIMKMSTSFRSQQKGLDALSTAVSNLLDDELGATPLSVFMLGAQYTMKQFALSCCLPESWQAYTSFTHHPFGEPFAVEVPDNSHHLTAMNIPIDSLTNMVFTSLRHRHPVAWEGRMEAYCNGNDNGNAVQKQRQQAFERGTLTDDHCMAIIGLAHDTNGQRYFIMKNSWGPHDGHNGMRLMSISDFMLNTIIIMAPYK